MPSLTAATIKSCSMSLSPLVNTSGSIWIESSCFWPFILTETIPPPAVASTTVDSICFCSFSCICWACFIICCKFIELFSLRGLHLGDISTEYFKKAFHERLILGVFDRRTGFLLLVFHYKRHGNGFTNEIT